MEVGIDAKYVVRVMYWQFMTVMWYQYS